MRKLLISISLIASQVLMGGCSSTTEKVSDSVIDVADRITGVYKIDIHQGNIVTQEQINQLRPGMDKRQVRFIMGTPLLIDAFHQERWDYFYSTQPGGGERTQQQVRLFFDDEKLVNLQGDFRPSNDFTPMSPNTDVVDVPKRDREPPGWFERTLIFLGMEYEER